MDARDGSRAEREREREFLFERETEHLWLRQLMHGIGQTGGVEEREYFIDICDEFITGTPLPRRSQGAAQGTANASCVRACPAYCQRPNTPRSLGVVDTCGTSAPTCG